MTGAGAGAGAGAGLGWAGALFFLGVGIMVGLQEGHALKCSSFGVSSSSPTFFSTQPPHATKLLSS